MGKGVKWELLGVAGGNVKRRLLQKTTWRFLRKVNTGPRTTQRAGSRRSRRRLDVFVHSRAVHSSQKVEII